MSTGSEAEVLASILVNLDPRTDRHKADAILCELIEEGTADPFAGPRAFKAWADFDGDDVDVERKVIVAAYRGLDEGDDDE